MWRVQSRREQGIEETEHAFFRPLPAAGGEVYHARLDWGQVPLGRGRVSQNKIRRLIPFQNFAKVCVHVGRRRFPSTTKARAACNLARVRAKGAAELPWQTDHATLTSTMEFMVKSGDMSPASRSSWAFSSSFMARPLEGATCFSGVTALRGRPPTCGVFCARNGRDDTEREYRTQVPASYQSAFTRAVRNAQTQKKIDVMHTCSWMVFMACCYGNGICERVRDEKDFPGSEAKSRVAQICGRVQEGVAGAGSVSRH